MGWLDQIPKAGNLYIGGLAALRRRDAIQKDGITHVVSVIRYEINEEMIRDFKHLQIEVDDEDDENLLENFTVTNEFIGNALDAGGKVFVHCAMGKSRSATICMAYIMQKLRINPTEALDIIRESRGVCEPNPGFMAQLWLYQDMGMPQNIDSEPKYQRWLYSRELESSRSVNQAPVADRIRFEDEHESDNSAAAEFELKCRKCRRTLATSHYLVPHTPKDRNGGSQKQKPSATKAFTAQETCAHHFVDALSWMRPELEEGKLEGRLQCPRCENNVGKYAWQGMACSCSAWIVPGISLAKGRIDQVRLRKADEPGSLTDNPAIRLPPGLSSQTGRRGGLL